MTETPNPPKTGTLTPAQNRVWRVMTIVAMAGVYVVISRDHNIREPFVAGVFIAASLAIAFFSRKFIRDNTDENGRWRIRQK